MKLAKPTLSQTLWISAALALVAGFIWLLWPHPKAVEVTTIGRGPVQQDMVDEGRTRIHNVFVIAAPVSGELQRISVEPGDSVTKGQVVATIYPAPPALLDARTSAQAQAGVLAAAAVLRSAEADLALAKRDQDRTKVLFDKGYASPAALDSANAIFDAARATVAARQAALKQAKVAAGTPESDNGIITQIKSPVSGRVLRLYQQSETVTPAGSPLIDIGDPADLEIVAEFLSQDAVRMKVGAPAYVEGWGGAQPIPAVVSRIEPYAHTKVSALGVEEQRVNVIARLAEPASSPPLGHGFRVDLRVIISRHPDVLRVPVDALVRSGANWSVFRLDHGKAILIPVAAGDGSGVYRLVSGGLSAGDQVILFPGDTLKSGDSVQPIAVH